MRELTTEVIILGRVLGSLLFISGLSVLVKSNEWKKIINNFRDKPEKLNLLGCFEVIGGVLIVNFHNSWGWEWTTIITVVGWLMILEGVIWMLLPGKFSTKFIKLINRQTWFKIGGGVSVLFGAYMLFETLAVCF